MQEWRPVTVSLVVALGLVFAVGLDSSHPAIASTSAEAVFDNTPSTPLQTEAGPTSQSYGWKFTPNEDADVASVTIWQNGSPNTSSVQILTNNNDTIGTSLGTFTYEPSASDATPVASYNGIDYFAFTYRGTATVEATDEYWLVVTGGSTPTRFVGTSLPNLAYASGAPGRPALTGNNFYNSAVPNPGSQYFSFSGSIIYILRRAVPNTGSRGQSPEVTRTLSLVLPAGMTCTRSTLSSTGPWVQLPAANECSLLLDPGTNAEPTLLGWATTPDFPSDIAQRQVSNGWGAYELFDAAGDMTAVFIPAGGWTQASSDTNLFPIFAG